MERLDISTIVKIKNEKMGEIFIQVTNRYFVEDSLYDEAGTVIYKGKVLNKPEYSLVQFTVEDIRAIFHPGEIRTRTNRDGIYHDKEL